MKYKLIVVLLGILIISGITIAVDNFGSFEKNNDDTFTETKQVTIEKSYPRLDEIDAMLIQMNKDQAVANQCKGLMESAETEEEYTGFLACAVAMDREEDIKYWTEIRTKLDKVK